MTHKDSANYSKGKLAVGYGVIAYFAFKQQKIRETSLFSLVYLLKINGLTNC